jgi:hypothetical protein
MIQSALFATLLVALNAGAQTPPQQSVVEVGRLGKVVPDSNFRAGNP